LRFGFAVQSAEMPFSVAVAQSVTAAAAASGVELLILDNGFDADIAVQNAEEFVPNGWTWCWSSRWRKRLLRALLTF